LLIRDSEPFFKVGVCCAPPIESRCVCIRKLVAFDYKCISVNDCDDALEATTKRGECACPSNFGAGGCGGLWRAGRYALGNRAGEVEEGEGCPEKDAFEEHGVFCGVVKKYCKNVTGNIGSVSFLHRSRMATDCYLCYTAIDLTLRF